MKTSMSVTGKLYSTIYNAFRHGKISLLILTQDLKFRGVNDESNKQTNTLAITRSQWNKILSNRTITINQGNHFTHTDIIPEHFHFHYTEACT